MDLSMKPVYRQHIVRYNSIPVEKTTLKQIAQLNVNIAVNIKFNNYDNRIVSPFLNNSVYHTHADINSIFLVQGTCFFQLAFQYCMCDIKKGIAKIRQLYYDSTKCQCNNETYNLRCL